LSPIVQQPHSTQGAVLLFEKELIEDVDAESQEKGTCNNSNNKTKKETTAEWERWILESSKERRYINISEHYS
jgi:hypothetical protein